jgi:hypothetical protein
MDVAVPIAGFHVIYAQSMTRGEPSSNADGAAGLAVDSGEGEISVVLNTPKEKNLAI